MIKRDLLTNKVLVISVAILCSFLLSALAIHNRPFFNADGALYLKTAESFLTGGFKSALHTYNWPFYSILIALFSKLTGLSLLYSAYGLNAIFDCLSMVIFVFIMRLMGLDGKRVWVSALVILLFHSFNGFRAAIIKDHGYWTFYLLSIFFFLAYLKNKKWYNGYLWAFSLIGAVLFRTEGIFFLVVIPWVVFLFRGVSWKEKTIQFIHMNAVCLILILSILLYLLIGGGTIHLGKVTVFLLRAQQYFQGIFIQWHGYMQILKQNLLIINGSHDAPYFFIFGLLGLYFVYIVKTLTFVYFFCTILFFVYYRKVLLANKFLALWGYVFFNMVLMLFVSFYNLFMVSRYFIGLVFPLVCVVPFVLIYLYDHRNKHKKKKGVEVYLFPIVLFLLVLVLVSNLFVFGPSKKYIYSATLWLKSNTPENSMLYTNDMRIKYLTNKKNVVELPPSGILPKANKKQVVGYLVLLGKGSCSYFTKGYRPIKCFYSKNKDHFLIIVNLNDIKVNR